MRSKTIVFGPEAQVAQTPHDDAQSERTSDEGAMGVVGDAERAAQAAHRARAADGDQRLASAASQEAQRARRVWIGIARGGAGTRVWFNKLRLTCRARATCAYLSDGESFGTEPNVVIFVCLGFPNKSRHGCVLGLFMNVFRYYR